MTHPVRGKARKGGAASPTPPDGATAAVVRTSDAHGGAWLASCLSVL